MTVPTHLPHPLGSYIEDASVHCDSAVCDWSVVGTEAFPCLHGLPTGHCLSHPSKVATRKICLHKTRNGSSKCIETSLSLSLSLSFSNCCPLIGNFYSPLQLDGEGESDELEEGEFGEYVETTAPY